MQILQSQVDKGHLATMQTAPVFELTLFASSAVYALPALIAGTAFCCRCRKLSILHTMNGPDKAHVSQLHKHIYNKSPWLPFCYLVLQVLSYHVIPSGAVLSTQLMDGMNASTLLTGADPLTVRLNNGSVTFVGAVNNATVKTADIKAGASVIHVIDDVLLPESDEPAENVTAAQGPTAAPAAAAPAAPARSGAAAAATGMLTVLLGSAVALLL
jgi:hypothetical protein